MRIWRGTKRVGREETKRYVSTRIQTSAALREGIQKRVHDPESYAVKNWIVNAQGFLLNCATEGFMANYDAIMSGKFGQDLFYGTNGGRTDGTAWRHGGQICFFHQWQSTRWKYLSRLL